MQILEQTYSLNKTKMKRIRRRKITIEQCRIIVSRGSGLISESVSCPDCGRVFTPGIPVETIAACLPDSTGEKLLVELPGSESAEGDQS
jgi:hypothetical protein